jgi:hypothetical protein
MEGAAADDIWNAAFAKVTVRGMMPPWYASLSNNGYQVVSGSGAYFYAERDPGTHDIRSWQGHMVRPDEFIHVPRTIPHFFIVMGDEPLELTFMGVKLSVCHGDRVPIDLSELGKELTLSLRAVVQGYEDDTCSVLGEEGTPFDIHNANQMFGVSENLTPGTKVEINLEFPGRPRETATMAKTINPAPYDGPMPPPEPFGEE